VFAVSCFNAIGLKIEALEKRAEKVEAALTRHNERLWELEIWAGKQQSSHEFRIC
jgi:hypothetical protein